MLRRKHTQGQALVEFALAATLIFFLLAAAVDVGLIFFALQGMHNAAQEGAAYGSRWGVQLDASNAIYIDKNAVVDHVRGESGAKGGNGFINLYDLDANGVDDRTEHGYNEPNIVIDVLSDPSNDGDPTKNVATGAAENVICTDPSQSTTTCYMRVTVKSVHKMIFAFAPAFAKNVPLTSAYIMPLRSSLSRGSSSNPAPPPSNCTVPNFVGKLKNQASNVWANANFIGTVTTVGSGNFTITKQSLTAGTSVPCSSSITVYES
jgi:hypothetical protein